MGKALSGELSCPCDRSCFIFFHKNIPCYPSFELFHRDSSNEGSQGMFSLRNKKIIFELYLIPLLSGALSLLKFSGLALFCNNFQTGEMLLSA